MGLTPAERAWVDQVRASAEEALTVPCDCGTCPTDEQLRATLALSDEDLLRAMT